MAVITSGQTAAALSEKKRMGAPLRGLSGRVNARHFAHRNRPFAVPGLTFH
jgi:hypothetical protein